MITLLLVCCIFSFDKGQVVENQLLGFLHIFQTSCDEKY